MPSRRESAGGRAARLGARGAARPRALLLALAVAVTQFIATAYGPPWNSMEGSGVTATGIKLPPAPTGQPGPYIIAVDPSVIPLHTAVKIDPNPFGDPNIVFQAEDTGGAIKGNRIDFLDMMGRGHQNAWGRRPVNLTVVNGPPATPNVNPSTSGGITNPPTSSGGGGGDLVHLLLDAVFIALGGALAFHGARQALGMNSKGGTAKKVAKRAAEAAAA